jgi:glutamine synthetase
MAVMLASGLDGVARGLDCGAPVDRNIFEMSEREKRRLRIRQLPANLAEALDNLEKDKVLRTALGDHIFDNYVRNKREEWHRYISVVTEWEREQYLEQF